ncbi:MAG: hotdog fold thioesterase [Arcanobacterium sp.]|nr:hotdog fold thioesterase [Arcanobacterium sp.]MDY5588963.1 hotdog fold thioesterase [Arcanobacterium sp.]
MSILQSAGVQLTKASPELVVLAYTVSEELAQIHGVLHGGISAAIAEEAASIGATKSAANGFIALGAAIESHHLRPVPIGTSCEARAFPEAPGGRLQVWRVEQRITSTGDLFNVSTVSLYLKKAPAECVSQEPARSYPDSCHHVSAARS